MTWIKDGAVERPTHFAERDRCATKNLKSTGMTLDGTPIALRPLLPEDEPALQDLFAHMSREDVRLRFFTPMRELKHALGQPACRIWTVVARWRWWHSTTA